MNEKGLVLVRVSVALMKHHELKTARGEKAFCGLNLLECSSLGRNLEVREESYLLAGTSGFAHSAFLEHPQPLSQGWHHSQRDESFPINH